ncbi:glycosyltransferase family 2 protein [Geodermatophilus sp. SYSU D00804]
MRHAVVIASVDRPELLAQAIRDLQLQTVAPDVVVVSVESAGDVPSETGLTFPVQVVTGERGLTKQRNRAIEALRGSVDLVTFLDDDAMLAHDYLEAAQAFLESHPEVVLFSGRVIADGAIEGEISRGAAQQVLAESTPDGAVTDVKSAYGCNMNVRADVFEFERFDSRLPAYGWLEDADFSARARRHGRVVATGSCLLVHLGVAGGRISGRRFGFSQIVNPHYLMSKGSLSRNSVSSLWLRAFVGNFVGLMRRDKRVDRTGRLMGNVQGFIAVVRRRADPEMIPRQ